MGFDGAKARFACQRGIADNFKRDVTGSDKRFGFVLPPNSSESGVLAVFESAVDALVHDVILQCDNTVLASVIAKDYAMTAIAFNRLLHDLRIQYKMGATWLWFILCGHNRDGAFSMRY